MLSPRKFKLFCFPYAGGASAVFNPWKNWLDRDIELRAVELAGRGKRIYDPLYTSIFHAVDDVYEMIKDELPLGPYALMGHSMGCIIAYELVQKLRKQNEALPAMVFFSGRGAPHLSKKEEEDMYYNLPDEAFREKVVELGGTPPEFFEHQELLEVFLPMLKRDFEISETYTSSPEISPLDMDIDVFIGKEEEVTAEQMHGWKDHTHGICNLHYFEGGHFFLHEKAGQIVDVINSRVRNFRRGHRAPVQRIGEYAGSL